MKQKVSFPRAMNRCPSPITSIKLGATVLVASHRFSLLPSHLSLPSPFIAPWLTPLLVPPWVNKLLFPPAIKNQRTEPLMTDLLVMLTKRIAELRQAGLEACHYVEEFFIRRIHPLGHRKTLAFECLRMTDPYCEPSDGCLFVLSPHC
jgi:hypothetical protein